MADPMPVDPKAARIVDLARRRQLRAAADNGLVPVDDVPDHESVPDARDVDGAPVDPLDTRRTLHATITDWGTAERPPLVPGWLRNPQQRREIGGWALRASGYHTARHGMLSPLYAAKTAWYAPVGLVRILWRIARWAAAEEGNWQLRQEAANRNEPQAWLALDARRQHQASWRWPLVGVGALAVIVAVAFLVLAAPGWVQILTTAAAVAAAARAGRPIDKPIIHRVSVRPEYRKLTAELTRKGIMATGLVKRPEDIRFCTGEIRRDGPGYLAVADLPDGVVAVDVVDRRAQLAGGLRLPQDQVWPEVMPREHPSRLALWVADRPVSAMRKPAWPLLSEATTDYFKPFAYGHDVRLRPVTWRLDERNSLFGGIPGSGKSLAARVVMLGAVLDPLVIPVISELKGSGDYDMFEPLCPEGMYISGADEGAIADTMRIVQWLHRLCEQRGPLVAKYARQGLNTVKKANRAMAERDERLRPVVALFDEVQEFMASPFGIKGDGAALLLSAIKRARAYAIHVVTATQRFDKESMPKAISSLVANRACLAVPAQPETDMVLGTSAYRSGARPNAFVPGPPPDGDSGWMVRAGFGPGYETVCSAYVDDVAAAAVCRRALALRGGRIADVDRPPARDLLDDLTTIWVPSETGAHWTVLAERLAVQFSEAYPALTAEALSAMVRALGVPSVDVKMRGERTPCKGATRKAIEEAIRRREIEAR